MEWVETTGRTLEEAKEAALDQLGVAADDAEFDVVAQPRQGLFGRLRTEARVRARVRPATPRVREERRRRKPSGPRASSGKGRSRGQGSKHPEVSGSSAADTPAAEVPPVVDAMPATDAPQPRRNPSRSRRRALKAGRSSTSTPGAAPAEASTPKEKTVAEDDVTLESQAEMASTFLAGLVEAFELEGAVATEFIDDETFEVRVDGDDLGLLIGPKGATLAAVQELTRTAVQRQVVNRTGRILVDVGGYQKQRKEALGRFTTKLAEEVIASGTRKILEPMSPADRKVVHDTCNEIEGVRTASEGEDPRRRVVIEPEG